MVKEEIISTLINYLGKDSVLKGMNYNKNSIDLIDEVKKGRVRSYDFIVESQRTYRSYNVKIDCDDSNKSLSIHCNCPQFSAFSTCKHVAACCYHYREKLFDEKEENKEERVKNISQQLIRSYYKDNVKDFQGIKKKVNVEVFINKEENDYYYYNRGTHFELIIKIGFDRMYSVNKKIRNFYDAYLNKDKFEFGKEFTYDPRFCYFEDKDLKILEYLYRNYDYIYNNYATKASLNSSRILYFFNTLKDKEFSYEGFKINEIKEEIPFKLKLTKIAKDYRLELIGLDSCEEIDNSYNYLFKKDSIYHLDSKIKTFVQMIKINKLPYLLFEHKDLKKFIAGILPLIQEKVELDDTIDDIVINVKPSVKLYFDFHYNAIEAKPTFKYGDADLSFFDKQTSIVRDYNFENKVVENLIDLGFVMDVENEKILLENIELIGEFLEDKLEVIATKYEVFTSQKIKDTKVVKNSNTTSNFSIGKDNIMHYEFDLGEIDSHELDDLLDSVKNKKKYFRLKNGDLINTYDNENLQQLNNLIEDMELSNKQIKEGSGVIPKYRAIYLDSLKKDKYKIITTNNLFDDLITKFTSFKDEDIKLNDKEKQVLRDYQVIGVKWLYNIYKCGFGGILADEMGVGKSIQLIYLIKLIIKEKKDAKILIVAPTSLIYNWENEFLKFAKNIKYQVFAENKIKRKNELKNIDDINVLITTYGLVREDEELYKNINFELIAIDEAQNIKNPTAMMTKIIKDLKASTKLALTGTPLENSVIELWSIFDFIMPGYLANNQNFKKKYQIKDTTKEDLAKLDTLNKQIQPFILRRKKKDVVKELPEKLENNIFLELTKEQKKIYAAQVRKTNKEMEELIGREGFTKARFKILQLLTRLRQICIDPSIILENYTGGSAKMDYLVPLIEEIVANNHKILLFTTYKTALDIAKKKLEENNISTYVISGEVSSKKRMELVNKFNNDDTNVFLITLKAGGTGLNLTSADVVIHLDLWWNPQVENQATDRAHRIGQKNKVEVVKLICKGTIEEKILKLQEKKKILSDKLIDGEIHDENMLNKLSEKDIKDLFAIDNEE